MFFHFLALLVVLVICVFPFYWMVTASFKQQPAILSSTPQFFFEPTLQNYVDAFGKFDILKSLKNSLFVALVTVVLFARPRRAGSLRDCPFRVQR